MFEIAPHFRPPLAIALAVVLPLLAGTAILLLRVPPRVRRRLLATAAAAALLLTAASAIVWSRRHAGTGTETAYGWPRIVYSRWESFEGVGHRSGIHWRGVLEQIAVYSVAGAAMIVAAWRVSHRRPNADSSARQTPT
jgi:hypothetical protein